MASLGSVPVSVTFSHGRGTCCFSTSCSILRLTAASACCSLITHGHSLLRTSTRLPRYCSSKVSGLLGDEKPLYTEGGLFMSTDLLHAGYFIPGSCADMDTSQGAWIPAEKYFPDQDLKLKKATQRLCSGPSSKQTLLWLWGLAFLFSQPARRGPGHHTTSAGACKAERERLDRSLAALFPNLFTPKATMLPREGVSVHTQLWQEPCSPNWASPQSALRQSPGRPGEGSRTGQEPPQAREALLRKPNKGQGSGDVFFLQPRLNREAPESPRISCGPAHLHRLTS